MRINIPLPALVLGAIIGLSVGAMFEFASSGTAFPILLVFGCLGGVSIGAIIEFLRHLFSLRQAGFEESSPALENLPADTVDFIKLIVKRMRYRKTVRDEVTAELAAHFEDALRDCKSNEDKEKKTRQLIDKFGDVKLLAVLLRRAKKRCRPLWRTIFARTCQTIVVLFVCLILYVVWFFSGKPAITTDYVAKFNRTARPAVDESLNAAPLYQQAVELYEKPSDDFLLFFADNYSSIGYETSRFGIEHIAERIHKLFSDESRANFEQERQQIQEKVSRCICEIISKKYDEAAAGEQRFIKKWLQEQKQALDLTVAAAQKPYCWREYKSGNDGSAMSIILLPHLAEFRKVAYCLRWRTWLNARQGRYEKAFSDIQSCYRMGRHQKEDKTLLEQLVGIALEALAVQTLQDMLGRYDIDLTQLTTLQRDFEKIIASEDFLISYEAEKLFVYDETQRCFTEDRLGGGHLYLPRLLMLSAGFIFRSEVSDELYDSILEVISSPKAWKAAARVLFTHHNKQETRKIADRLYAYFSEAARKTPAQRRADNTDVGKQAMKIIDGNLLLQILMPATARISELSYRLKTDVQATDAIIALLRYKKDKGYYPENLQKLVNAGYLKQLPIDLYSDKPLIYRKTDNNFLLYSIGEDFKDDGGRVARGIKGNVEKWPGKGDMVFWPVPKPETPQEMEKRLQEQREKQHRRRQEHPRRNQRG